MLLLVCFVVVECCFCFVSLFVVVIVAVSLFVVVFVGVSLFVVVIVAVSLFCCC